MNGLDLDNLLDYLDALDADTPHPLGIWPATGYGACTTDDVRRALAGDRSFFEAVAT